MAGTTQTGPTLRTTVLDGREVVRIIVRNANTNLRRGEPVEIHFPVFAEMARRCTRQDAPVVVADTEVPRGK